MTKNEMAKKDFHQKYLINIIFHIRFVGANVKVLKANN